MMTLLVRTTLTKFTPLASGGAEDRWSSAPATAVVRPRATRAAAAID
jgi:hypothetical protein